MASRIETIYDIVLPEMEAQGIPDTSETRLAALEAIKDEWLTNGGPLTMGYYMLAINIEIARLTAYRPLPV